MPYEPQPAPTALRAAGEVLSIRPLPGGRGLALDGEADVNSCQALREMLRGLAGAGPRDLDLELAGLRFIDVSCTREIIQAIDCLRPARVRLRHPPRAFHRIAGCLKQRPVADGPLPGRWYTRGRMPAATCISGPRPES